MAYNHQKLKVLIESEADNSSKTEEEILTWLKTERTVNVSAKTTDLINYLALEGIWIAMETSADSEVQAAKKELDMLTQRLDIINTQAARFVAMVDSLVTKGILTETNKAEILARSDKQQTPIQESGLGRVVLGDVIVARRI